MAVLTLRCGPRRPRGFTLIELLVAISVMAVMAVMAWRALDGMQRASTQTRTHTDAVLTVDGGLAQWVTDLDALQEIPQTIPIDWNGRALRITRRNSASPQEGVLVVAWTRDVREGVPQWLRWQSAPLQSQQAWQLAWRSADQWAQNQNATEKAHEVAIAPIEDWKIYFFRGGAWSNALSSAGTPAAPVTTDITLPDGVRLVLTLSASHPLAGDLTRDWAKSIGIVAAQ